MRRELAFAVLAGLPIALAAAQQAAPPAPPPAASAQPSAQTVYYAGPGVTAPELLPVTVTDLAVGHCRKLDGTVILSAIVDATGVARSVSFLSPLGNELDQEAIRLVMAERFKPGTRDRAPSAVAVAIKLDMKACLEEGTNDSGQTMFTVRLRSVPEQSLELAPSPSASTTPASGDGPPSMLNAPDMSSSKSPGNIYPPMPLKQPEAVYSDKARREGISGTCLVSLIVDSYGMPQNVHIVKSLTPDLDQKALEAVRGYRFRPARKGDGTPVPVKITVQVDFHLYK